MNALRAADHGRLGQAFVNLILQGEPVEQEKEREYFTLDAPVSVTRGDSSIIALPCDELKISCTSADDRGIHTQHLSLDDRPGRVHDAGRRRRGRSRFTRTSRSC